MAIVVDFVQLPADTSNTGKRVRNVTLTEGGQTVYGQVTSIGDPQTAGVVASVKGASTAAVATDMALVTVLRDGKLPTALGSALSNASLPIVPASDYLGTLSTLNSTATTLAGSAVFTGLTELALDYAGATIYVYSDVASAANGLSIRQSSNGTNWDNVDVYTIPAGTGKTFNVAITAAYFSIQYTNGATTQIAFRLQVIFHRNPKRGSSVRPQDARGNDNDMEEMLGYVMGYDPVSNTWSRITLKPASTAPLAADPAVVVALSPNSALDPTNTDVNYVVTHTTLTSGVNLLSKTIGDTGWLDTSLYRSISFTITPGSGTITAGAVFFDAADDTGTALGGVFIDDLNSLNTTSFSLASSTVRIFSGSLKRRYIRARIAPSVAGITSINVGVTLRAAPYVTALASVTNGGVTLTDAFTNASMGQNFAPSPLFLFNGTSWDRQRNNWNTTTGDTGAKTATFNGAMQTNFNSRGAVLVFQIPTVTGTSPTLTLKLQGTLDAGTSYYDIPGAATVSITSAGNVLLMIFPGAVAIANAVINQLLPRNWRVVGTIGGTSPSFTITAIQVGYVN